MQWIVKHGLRVIREETLLKTMKDEKMWRTVVLHALICRGTERKSTKKRHHVKIDKE